MWNIIWFGLIVLIIVILGAIVAGTYNSLVKLRNGVENAWSKINVQLERRSDLISNLVETVKGYSSHEKTTFKDVTKARSRLSDAETVEENVDANNMLTETLKSLFAVAENYPELKADESFEELMAQLAETEDKIASYREVYNDMVLTYNNKCEMFPSNMIASFFRFEEAAFFEIEEEETELPKVDFKE
ncbi:MAG TPA: LemA family protein [Methanobacteriaceae archaeon]|nr:LemA family protein [Methanobacteriaceae archaeon]